VGTRFGVRAGCGFVAPICCGLLITKLVMDAFALVIRHEAIAIDKRGN